MNFHDPQGLNARAPTFSTTVYAWSDALPFYNAEYGGVDWDGGVGGGGGRPGPGPDPPGGGATQGGIQRGSAVFADALDALTADKTSFYELFMGIQSADCEADLKSVGVTDIQMAMGALNANIINGLGVTAATTTYAQGV